MKYRIAVEKDFPQLAKIRWDFQTEEDAEKPVVEKEIFVEKCAVLDVSVDDKLDLNDGKRKIEVLFLGRAHTGADLVVRLPKENIVVSGDLTVFPIPFVGSTSYPLEYGATLENLLKLNAKIIIPGHGAVMRDDSYIRQMIRLLNSIKAQSEAAFQKGETLEAFRKKSIKIRFSKLRFSARDRRRFQTIVGRKNEICRKQQEQSVFFDTAYAGLITSARGNLGQ